jgi:hypothetical protein
MLLAKFEDSTILLGVSPLVFDMSNASALASERIFPKILNAYSDHRLFYQVQKLGIPGYVEELARDNRVKIASHGLLHVDHRLMDKSAQEVSILTSCSLARSKVFIPPFNKWNEQTEEICAEAGIELIKFEDGWRHLGYNKVDLLLADKYYYHTHDFTDEGFAGAIL